MSDRPVGSGGSSSAGEEDDRGRDERKRPRPVRPSGPSSAEGRQRGKMSRKKKKPTPVRDLASTEVPSSPTEPDLEEARVSVGEEGWVVRVLGRAGGKANAATPLLLLGFWKEGEDDGAPVREALVVGRTLASLTVPALRGALESSDLHRARSEARPERGRRGRGPDGRRGFSRKG